MAAVSLDPVPTSRPVRKVIWMPTCAATRSATSAAIPKPVPNAVRGAIRRPTCAAPRRILPGECHFPLFTIHSSLFVLSSPLALPGLAPIMAQAPRADVRY